MQRIVVVAMMLLTLFVLPAISLAKDSKGDSIVERARKMLAQSNKMTGVSVVDLQFVGPDPKNPSVLMFAIEFDRPTSNVMGFWSVLEDSTTLYSKTGIETFRMDKLKYVHLITFNQKSVSVENADMQVALKVGTIDPLTGRFVLNSILISGNEVIIPDEADDIEEGPAEPLDSQGQSSNDAIVHALGDCVAQISEKLNR